MGIAFLIGFLPERPPLNSEPSEHPTARPPVGFRGTCPALDDSPRFSIPEQDVPHIEPDDLDDSLRRALEEFG